MTSWAVLVHALFFLFLSIRSAFFYFKRLSLVLIEIHWSTSLNPIVCVHLCQSLSTTWRGIHNVPCFYLCLCFCWNATCYAFLNEHPLGCYLPPFPSSSNPSNSPCSLDVSSALWGGNYVKSWRPFLKVVRVSNNMPRLIFTQMDKVWHKNSAETLNNFSQR